MTPAPSPSASALPSSADACAATTLTPWTLPSTIPKCYEADGLILRTYTPDDAVALLMAVRESRDTLHPWLPWARFDHRNLPEAYASISRLARELTPAVFEAGHLNLVLGVFDRASGRLLGGTGFHTFRPRSHQAEIGYWLRAGERGRGVCTRTAAAMISWAFTPQAVGGWGLRRVEIICSEHNQPSAAVPRRLGMREENRTRGDMWIPGREWGDTLRFAVLADEWDPRAGRVRV